MAQWRLIVVVDVYLSPNLDKRTYCERLRALERHIISRHPAPVIIAGDFNAKSGVWGSPRNDWRGDELLEVEARCDLAPCNTGSENTCVRMRGGSIVDLTWVTRPAERLVRGWRVLTEAETLSDHRYIGFSVTAFTREVLERRRLRENASHRWALRKLDEDAFLSTVEAVLMTEGEEFKGDLDGHRAWLQKTMEKACNAAMPR
ncbi:reverse transcriptase, partial [Lasius niger]